MLASVTSFGGGRDSAAAGPEPEGSGALRLVPGGVKWDFLELWCPLLL